MGSKTFNSLPNVLPNRTHIVLTTQNMELPSGVIKCDSIENFMTLAQNIDDEIYVIGGGLLYKELLPFTDMMYLTEFDAICKDATVYFPKIDQDNWEREVNHIDKDNNPPYLRKVYIRKNN